MRAAYRPGGRRGRQARHGKRATGGTTGADFSLAGSPNTSLLQPIVPFTATPSDHMFHSALPNRTRPRQGQSPCSAAHSHHCTGRRYNLAQCWAQEWNAGVAGPHCPPGSAPAPAPTRPGRRPQARACARLCEPAPCPQACGRESAPPYRQAGRARLPPVPAAPCPPFAHCRPAVAGPHSQRLWTQASDFGCTQPCAQSEIHFFHTKFPDSLNSTVG